MDVSLGLQIREVGFLLTLVQVLLLKSGERQWNVWNGLERKGASVGLTVECVIQINGTNCKVTEHI